MSNLLVTPELVAAAAADLAGIGSAIGAANAAAGAPTMALLAAGADEVSAAVAAVFSSYAQQYQALSAAAAAFHDQFVRALAAGAGAYAGAEAANVEQQLLNAINAPTLALLGRPLIGNGADGAAGTGQAGGAGGLLYGNGGNGGSGAAGQAGGAGAEDHRAGEAHDWIMGFASRAWRPAAPGSGVIAWLLLGPFCGPHCRQARGLRSPRG